MGSIGPRLLALAPGLERVLDGGEREVSGRRELVRSEPAELGDVVRGDRLPLVHLDRPVDVQRGGGVGRVAVDVHPDADEAHRPGDEPGLLLELATKPVERVLALLEEPAGTVPEPEVGLDRPTGEEQPALGVLDEGADARRRVGVVRRAAAGAVQVRLLAHERRLASGAGLPAMEEPHLATVSA